MLFPHAKLQGEWAEACFAAEALRRGFIVSRPLGDSAPYDFVLEWRPERVPYICPGLADVGPSRNNIRENPCKSVVKVFRVQVKSVSVRNPPGGIYHVATMRSVATAKKAYSTGDFDFLAAFIIPRRLWYIIPAREIVGIKMISLCPGHRPATQRSPGAPFKPSFGLSGEVPETSRAALKNPRPSALLRGERFSSKLETGNSKLALNEKRGTRNEERFSSERLTFRPRRLEQYRSAWRLLCDR